MHTIKYIPINQIVIDDESTQMRADGYDWDFVDSLAEVVRSGEELDPCVLFHDAAQDIYYIGDGWHRTSAYRNAQSENANIPAEVRPGGKPAAFHFALSANVGKRAKPLTRKDRRKSIVEAINTYILSPDSVKNMQCIFSKNHKKKATQKEIAEMCKVNQSNVSRIFKELKSKTPALTVVDKPDQKAPTQITFFDRFDRVLQPVCSKLEEALNFTGYSDPEVTKEDKLKSIKTLELNLSQFGQKIKDLKLQISKTI